MAFFYETWPLLPNMAPSAKHDHLREFQADHTLNQVPFRLVFYQMENMKYLNIWFPVAIKFVGAQTKYVQVSHMQWESTSLFQNSKYSNKMVVKLLFRTKEKPSTYDEIRPVESCATRKAQVCFRIRNMQTMVVKLLFQNKEKPSTYDEIRPVELCATRKAQVCFRIRNIQTK